MSRFALLLCLCLTASVASAAPKYKHKALAVADADVVAAEKLWTVAAKEKNAAKAQLAWGAASAAFTKLTQSTTLARADKQEAAMTALLALKNADPGDPRSKRPENPKGDYEDVTPMPIPPREQRLFDAMELARSFDPSSDDGVGLAFVQANTLRRYRQFDKAVPMFIEILDKHRDHDTAEYAAALLLDIYNRQQRFDDLMTLVNKLYADRKFLDKHDDLKAQVMRARAEFMRRAQPPLERPQTREDWLRCGEKSLADAEKPGVTNGDDELYDALYCFQKAGSLGQVREIAATMRARYPNSKRLPRTNLQAADADVLTGRFADAAAAEEAYATKYVAELNATWAISDAIFFRLGLGDLDQATRDLAVLAKADRKPGKPTLRVTQLNVANALVAADNRREAARVLRTPPFESKAPVDAPYVLSTQLRSAVACPVALVDELCPQPRDARLTGALRAELTRMLRTPDTADDATRVRLDLELETALAKRSGARPLADLVRGYAQLLARGPAIKIVAHVRLARLARAAGNTAEAGTHLSACIQEASTALVGAEWIAGCERDLAALALPVTPLNERLQATSASLAPVLEPAITSR